MEFVIHTEFGRVIGVREMVKNSDHNKVSDGEV